MAGDTTITVVGNLTADPGAAVHPRPVRPSPTSRWRRHPAIFDRQSQRVEGRRSAVHALQHLA